MQGNTHYYCNGIGDKYSGIIREDMTKEQEIEIIRSNDICEYLTPVGDYLYYITNGYIYKYNLLTKEKERIAEELTKCTRLSYVNGRLYFSSTVLEKTENVQVYKYAWHCLDIKTGKITEIVREYTEYEIINDKIYYRMYVKKDSGDEHEWQYYCMNTDMTDKTFLFVIDDLYQYDSFAISEESGKQYIYIFEYRHYYFSEADFADEFLVYDLEKHQLKQYLKSDIDGNKAFKAESMMNNEIYSISEDWMGVDCLRFDGKDWRAETVQDTAHKILRFSITQDGYLYYRDSDDKYYRVYNGEEQSLSNQKTTSRR